MNPYVFVSLNDQLIKEAGPILDSLQNLGKSVLRAVRRPQQANRAAFAEYQAGGGDLPYAEWAAKNMSGAVKQKAKDTVVQPVKDTVQEKVVDPLKRTGKIVGGVALGGGALYGGGLLAHKALTSRRVAREAAEKMRRNMMMGGAAIGGLGLSVGAGAGAGTALGTAAGNRLTRERN